MATTNYDLIILDILNAMKAQGWKRFPTSTDLLKALKAGISKETLIQHFSIVLSKYSTPMEAYMAGHGANLRIHKSMYPYLLNGTGIGYTAWSATEADQKKLYGYSQADLDALSAANPEKYITDYWTFVGSGGLQGWKPRTKDAFGNWL